MIPGGGIQLYQTIESGAPNHTMYCRITVADFTDDAVYASRCVGISVQARLMPSGLILNAKQIGNDLLLTMPGLRAGLLTGGLLYVFRLDGSECKVYHCDRGAPLSEITVTLCPAQRTSVMIGRAALGSRVYTAEAPRVVVPDIILGDEVVRVDAKSVVRRFFGRHVPAAYVIRRISATYN